MTAAPVALAGPTRRASKLYRDAAALASSSMITAVLGMGFWALCAHLIPPAKLGVQTALLSIMVAPAIMVASGVGDAFTALIPAAGLDRAAVVSRGYRLLVSMAGVLGVIAAVLAVTVLPEVRGSLPVAALVLVGVLIWSLFVVQDPALTSMRRAHWLPVENGSVSLAKIALLPAAIALGIAQPVVVATLIPPIIAIGVLFPQVTRLARTDAAAAAAAAAAADAGATVVAGARAALPKLVARTTTSVGLSLGTLTVTPFIVTAVAGPARGAAFSLCLAIVQSLDFVGSAMGVSLVVHASAAADEAAPMALAVFKRTALVVGAGAVALILVAPHVLRVLNPSYLSLHGPATITILAVGSFCRCVYVIWAALQRARRRMRGLLTLNAVAATVVFATLPYFAARWGAVGAAVVIAGAQIVLSAGAGVHLLYSARVRGARRAGARA